MLLRPNHEFKVSLRVENKLPAADVRPASVISSICGSKMLPLQSDFGTIRAIYPCETKIRWTVQKIPMEDEKLGQGEVWTTIRYLDPDERHKNGEVKSAAVLAVLALVLIVCAFWLLLWLRVRGL